MTDFVKLEVYLPTHLRKKLRDESEQKSSSMSAIVRSMLIERYWSLVIDEKLETARLEDLISYEQN